MNYKYLGFILIYVCLHLKVAIAQKVNSSDVGVLKGVVYDSAHNYRLRLASIAVYDDRTSELVAYSLTNQFGEFTFNKIPLDNKLNLLISMDGYVTAKVNLSVSKVNKLHDCKFINLKPANDQGMRILDEVIIKSIAPVKMNGDTLEFNANAFRLDSNAVVEDLIRKLPGFILWGDGLITVNGRKVERVLVGGKPFFGDNAKTALQNLPKESVEKVQVYNVNDEKKGSIDSLTEVNIKLKKGKLKGIFAKAGVGLGTQDRRTIDGMLSIFNNSTQLSLVGTSNNTNAIPNNTNTLIQYNSFKGLGADIEYQPDFTVQGITTSKAIGTIFQHDFISTPTYNNNNRLQGDYLLRRTLNDYSRNTNTQIAVTPIDKIIQTEKSQDQSVALSHTLNGNYNKKTTQYEFQLSSNLSVNDGSNVSNSFLDQQNSDKMLSSSSRLNQNNFLKRNGNINIQFKTKADANKLWGGMELGYRIANTTLTDDQRVFYELVPLNAGVVSTKIERLNHANSNEITQTLTFGSKQIKRLLFNRAYLWGINIGLNNIVNFSSVGNRNNVQDLDSTSSNYLINQYLTNTNRYKTTSYTPTVILSKNFRRSLADRFENVLDLSVNIQSQYFLQKNNSDKSFQNFTRQYNVFLPAVVISGYKHRFGQFRRTISLEFRTKADYPTLIDIAPLTDSSSLNYLRIGNTGIKNQRTNQMTINYNYQAEKRNKNNININAMFTVGLIQKKMADSIAFNAVGRQSVAVANVNGYRFANGTFLLMQPVRLNTISNLQFTISGSLQLQRSPNYINNNYNITHTQSWSNKFDVSYLYNNTLTLNFHQEYSNYHSQQSINSQTFSNKLSKSSFNSSFFIFRSFTVTNNFTLNDNRSSVFPRQRFTIWNLSLTKRLLKKNNLECKISAYDLLHNNKGILAYGDNSSLTTGTVNVLRNYYMFTLAYYPRKF